MKKFSLNNDIWTHPELKNIHWTDGVNNLINNHNDIVLAISWINECIGKIKQHQLLTYDSNKQVNFECLKDFTVWHLQNNHPLYSSQLSVMRICYFKREEQIWEKARVMVSSIFREIVKITKFNFGITVR